MRIDEIGDAVASVEIEANINKSHLNGYDGGTYNMLVTMFSPDDYGYIANKIKSYASIVIYNKKKDGSQRSSGGQSPSLLNESSFNNSISPTLQKVNTQNKETYEQFQARKGNKIDDYTEKSIIREDGRSLIKCCTGVWVVILTAKSPAYVMEVISND